MPARSLEEFRHEVRPHDHAVVVYDAQESFVRPLARFVEEGVARNDLVVFVHAFESDDEAWDLLERAYPGAREQREARVVVISLYSDAFEREGRIDYEHVGEVVASLQDTAREAGRDGVRVFVDASRRYFSDARVDEWFAFESWLGARLSAGVGLVCAYQRGDIMDPRVIADVLRTHAYRFDAPPAR